MRAKEMRLEEEMTAQPVRSLQHMLRRLSKRYDFLPELQPDGRFGEYTLESVMLFQKYLAPPVTGVVDQRTWTAIRDAWLEVERELLPSRQLRGFPEGEITEIGESRAYLYVVQGMFQALSEVMEGLQEERIDGIHSGNSVENTIWLQQRADLPPTGKVDRKTWDALTKLYELLVVRTPHGVMPPIGRG